MPETTRREFGQAALGSLLTALLLETLFQRDAFGAAIKPITEQWLKDIIQLSNDCGDGTIKQTDWQEKVEKLFKRVELAEMLQMIDFEKVSANVQFREQGERSLGFRFPDIEGLPRELAFGKQIFALKKDRSVIPHGHNNLATAFYILAGEFHGRHYDRLRDEAEVMIIRPTIDRNFGVADCSTISDYKDNVHWFKALTDTAFIFNIHVRVPQAEGQPRKPTGRVYIDPEGQHLKDGTIAAPLAKYSDLMKKYG